MPRGPTRIIVLGLAAIAVFVFVFGSSSSTTSTSGYGYVLTSSERWRDGINSYTSTEKWKQWVSSAKEEKQKFPTTTEKVSTNRVGGDLDQVAALKVMQAERLRNAETGHTSAEPATTLASTTATTAVTTGTTASVETGTQDNTAGNQAEATATPAAAAAAAAAAPAENKDLAVSEEQDGAMRQMQEEHENLVGAADAGTTTTAAATDATTATTTAGTTLTTTTKAAQSTKAASASNEVTKALIIAKPNDKSVAWIKQEFSDWNSIIYNVSASIPVDSPRQKSTSKQTTVTTEMPLRGGAAMAFLTYVTENYDSLADIMLFVSTIPFAEAKKNGWVGEEKDSKADLSELAPTLHSMNTSYIKAQGYTSLRCDPDPGCTKETTIQPLGANFYAQPWHHEIPMAWRALFPAAEAVPADISAPAGAQFAVSAAQVHRRGRSEYSAMRTWLRETRMDEGPLQRVMSALWHVVFARPAVDCPDQAQCVCEFYGRCTAADEKAAAATDGKAVNDDGKVDG